MGPIGMGEVVVLFILALLIFGPKKLPELGKTFGKGMAEFKRASNELRTTFQREMDNIEHETREVGSLATDVRRDINTSYYDDSEDDYYSDYDYGSGSAGSATSAKPNGSDQATDTGKAADGEGGGEAAEGSAATPPAVSGVPEAEGAAGPTSQA